MEFACTTRSPGGHLVCQRTDQHDADPTRGHVWDMRSGYEREEEEGGTRGE